MLITKLDPVSRPGEPREIAKLLLGCAIFICLIVSTANAQNLRPDQPALQSITDMLVVTEGSEVVIYVSDSAAEGIYYVRRPATATGAIDFAEFKPLVSTGPKYRSPSGLAYHSGNLFVADRYANVILRIDPKTAQVNVLELKGLLSQPEHIAFSDAGVLAVGSDQTVQYFHPKIGDTKVEGTVKDIDRMIFDGQALVVLDEDGGGDIYGANAHPEFLDSQTHLALKKAFAPDFRNQLPSIQDFALYRGVFYIAGKEEVIVFSRSQLRSDEGAQPLPVPIDRKTTTISRISNIAVSDFALHLVDPNRKKVWMLPRPVPILVDFPSAAINPTNEHPKVVSTLKQAEVLLTRTIVTEKPYESLNQLVLDHLFWRSKEFPSAIDNSATTSFAGMICTLNGWPCEKRKTDEGWSLVKQAGFVGLRNEVVIPNIQIKSYLVKKVAVPVYGANSLWEFLTKSRIVPLAYGARPLAAGDIVTVANDSLNAPAPMPGCDLFLAEKPLIVPASFPREILLTPDQFANQIGLKNGSISLQKMGVSNVVANYGEVYYERGPSPFSLGIRSCLEDRGRDDSSVYVVDRVMFAQKTNYRFLDQKGKLVEVDPKLLGMAQVHGQPDFSQQRSWLVDSRLNLGYVALQFSLKEQSTRPIYLEPVVIPVKSYAQQITLLIDAANVSKAVRVVNDLAVNNPVRFYAAAAQDQAFTIKENSSSPPMVLSAAPSPSPVPPVSIAQAAAANDQLRNLIRFTPELSDWDLGETPVGIVENPNTIETRHQSFYAVGPEWSWGDRNAQETKEGYAMRQLEPGRVKQASEYKKGENGEHGTHVAAIVGAKSVLKGLTPTVRLVKVNVKRLRVDMEDVVNSGVQIFNLSSYSGPDDGGGLVAAIKYGLGRYDLLLIIAAGEENKNFSEPGTVPTAPVSWLSELPDNVIVVGAGTGSYPVGLFPRANRSKKFVQLLVPAENVYSATKENTYAPGSGSSQGAPQVAAVAALLRSLDLSTSLIKAVLIYTATWREDLMEDVWGGILNAYAAFAVSKHGKDLIWLSADAPPILLTPPKRYSIKVAQGALIVDPSQPKSTFKPTREDLEIPSTDLLRIQQMDGPNKGFFRIVYLEKRTGQLTMLLRAQIQGDVAGVRCKIPKDPLDGKLITTDLCAQYPDHRTNDEGEIDFTKVVDYMRRVPFGPDRRPISFPVPGTEAAQSKP